MSSFGHVYLLHLPIWRHRLFTRGHVATCNKYTWPNVFQMHAATLSVRHMAIWPRDYSNRYCSHVANGNFFCSGTLPFPSNSEQISDLLSIRVPFLPGLLDLQISYRKTDSEEKGTLRNTHKRRS
jgi:hypothetical protein